MKLSELYKSLSKTDRALLAERADVGHGYLWQIATGWRGKRPSLLVLDRLLKADSRLKAKDLIAEFVEQQSTEPHMPNTPDPKPDDRIPIGPPDCITKGGAHA